MFPKFPQHLDGIDNMGYKPGIIMKLFLGAVVTTGIVVLEVIHQIERLRDEYDNIIFEHYPDETRDKIKAKLGIK
jgi:hypothetical protein